MKLFRPLTSREKWILYTTILLGILYILINFLVIPTVSKLRSFNQEIDKKSTLLKKYTHLAKRAPAIISLYDNLKEDIKLEVNLQEETNSLLKEIEKIADSSGLIVQGIKPLTPKKERNYTKVYLEVNCQGDMKSTLDFICRLENTSLLVVIPSLKISPQKNDPNILRSLLKVYKILF